MSFDSFLSFNIQRPTWNCWDLEEWTPKWQRSPASRERADIKIIPHPHQNCPIATAKVMTFPRWDEGRLCGFLKLAFPRSLKMFQQEPADHTKKSFSFKHVPDSGVLETDYSSPPPRLLILMCYHETECHQLVPATTTEWCHQHWTRA